MNLKKYLTSDALQPRAKNFIMFNRKTKPEKIATLERASPFMLSVTATLTLSSGLVAAGSIATHGSLLLATSMVGTAIGSMTRFVRDIDDFAVGKYLSGRSGLFSKLIYKVLKRTPLRIYTINQLSQRVEWLQNSGAEKSALKVNSEAQRVSKLLEAEKSQNISLTENELRDARTISYISVASDYRKHLRYIMTAFLGVFAGLRMISSFTEGKPITLFQIISRIVGYTYGMGFAAGQIDAYVQRRAAEPIPRPFFRIANKAAAHIWPIRMLGNWFIRRDYENISSLERGDQVWRWRFKKKLIDKIPVPFLRNSLLKRHDAKRLQITPAVVSALKEKGVDVRIDLLKALVQKRLKETAISPIRMRAAYSELMQHTDASTSSIQQQYEEYKDAVVKRNNTKGLETPRIKRGIASMVAASIVMCGVGVWGSSAAVRIATLENVKGKYGSAESRMGLQGKYLTLRDPSGKIVYSSERIEPTLKAARAVAKEFVTHGVKPLDNAIQSPEAIVHENWNKLFGIYELEINGKFANISDEPKSVKAMRKIAERQLGYGS